MGNPRQSLGAVLAALAVLTAGGCSAPAARDAVPAGSTQTGSTQTGTERRGGPLTQSAADIRRTVESLRRVDDLPLYEMTFHGSYDVEAPLTEEELAAPADGWACSLFSLPAAGPGDRPLFGRNFDWNPSPAMVVHADPPGGHASLSLVDLSYALGSATPPDLDDPRARRRMAHAVLIPFDGVNDKGLAVGMAAVPDGELPPRTAGRPALGSVRIIRMILDRAATVEEALAIVRRYDVDFTGGPQLHYLIADATGRSAVVEYAEGRLSVIDDRVLTNFTMTGTGERERAADARYRELDEGLPAARSWRDGMALLQRVAQGHTRWSVVYDLADATARVVTAKRWGRVHTIPLVQR
ncbi:linear amide C-N hydrolase [Planomonospora sp. ID67723]|uniref:linear amide C-N hydrolase n=1 Tax=Planomonospora sp. ID67723 TaxID=2738134 RepID=UPI0018C41E57|nr:linear amide C-N hydrolase [Planomonospora sp. ID67723]MBG0832979.1 linear amide C-N hydrolase [Planomonospora sp. ID67723]